MYYVVSFDNCGIESPLRSRSPESALALAQEAERNGCENILVKLPAGDVLSLHQFVRRYFGGSDPLGA